jgi:hypothetical protein
MCTASVCTASVCREFVRAKRLRDQYFVENVHGLLTAGEWIPTGKCAPHREVRSTRD